LTEELARKRFIEFTDRTTQIPDDELDDFWESLSPVGIDFMIGEWKGGEFHTGHPANGAMAKGNWFGKTFVAPDDAKPLICLDAEGNKFSNTAWMNGEASLWLEEFRGEVTATMVYDGQPIHDHFKKIDHNAVLGIMNGKKAVMDGRYLYFYLERI
jgi:hypothetical protein